MTATADRVRISRRTPPPSSSQPAAVADGSAGRCERRFFSNKKGAAAAMLLLCAIAILAVVGLSANGSKRGDKSLLCHTISRGDLPIRVTERGSLESQENIEIQCEVEDVPGDGIEGTTILWIVPNGSFVKKGALLVELDSASHEKRVDDQILETEEERAHQLRHTATYENTKTHNETSLANAELAVELAELELQSFEDKEGGGVFQMGLQDIEMQIQVAEAKKLISDANLKGREALYDLGYSSRGDVAEARLALLNANTSLARANAERKLQTDYQYYKGKLRLAGALETAKRNLIQVKRNNEWMLAQALAWKRSSERRLKKYEERLARCQEAIRKCKIYAPQDGMVVYGWGIREGEAVYQRRTILTLPNLSRMQVKTTVHESGVNQVKPGLPATVRVDARPRVSYKGSVRSVAVLPDQSSWLNSDVKAYETIVRVDEEVERLQPGMTAVVEIEVAHAHDVLIAPVEAIVQIDGAEWCYVNEGGNIERRHVALGAMNDQFAEVQSGLDQGDQVVRNPMAVADEAKGRQQMASPGREAGDAGG